MGFVCAATIILFYFTQPLRAQPPTYPEVSTNADEGFDLIFDGKTLTDWQGDPKYWRVENGCLVGEVTPQTLLGTNSFIIWRGGVTLDFELKVEYRIGARQQRHQLPQRGSARRAVRNAGVPGRHRRRET